MSATRTSCFTTTDDVFIEDLVKPTTTDLTLAMLRNSRARYATNGIRECYVEEGAGCAIGVVMIEDSREENEQAYEVKTGWEEELSSAAREALALLDRVAVQLHPRVAWREWLCCASVKSRKTYLGARIECVNENSEWRVAKKRVLRCYDVAIAEREEMTA